MVCFDFDGVFTDCKFHMLPNGEISKTYNGQDSYAIYMLKERGIKSGIISSDNSNLYKHIFKKNHFNKLDFMETGIKNKIKVLNKWKEYYNFDWKNIVYMGDDLSDKECLINCGLSVCPNNAVKEIKEICDIIINKEGGNGAVREIVEQILLKM